MSEQNRSELEQLQQEVSRRQYYQRAPRPMADALARLMSRRGYAQQISDNERGRLWADLVGAPFAGQSRAGRLNRGVLEVVVANSAALQQLTFKKQEVLRQMAERAPEMKISDLRFRIGPID